MYSCCLKSNQSIAMYYSCLLNSWVIVFLQTSIITFVSFFFWHLIFLCLPQWYKKPLPHSCWMVGRYIFGGTCCHCSEHHHSPGDRELSLYNSEESTIIYASPASIWSFSEVCPWGWSGLQAWICRWSYYCFHFPRSALRFGCIPDQPQGPETIYTGSSSLWVPGSLLSCGLAQFLSSVLGSWLQVSYFEVSGFGSGVRAWLWVQGSVSSWVDLVSRVWKEGSDPWPKPKTMRTTGSSSVW